jgi:hypothetical protein
MQRLLRLPHVIPNKTLWNMIDAAWMKRVTFGKPYDAEKSALEDSVSGNGFGGILRAGRVESAPRA